MQEPAAIRYRPEIDGLRAIAVLAVVLYHAGFGPAAGYVGVDVFFVISGYLITSLLIRESRGTGRIDVMAFYARRVRRIFPALVVVVAFAVMASMIVLSPFGPRREMAYSAAASLLFVGNVFFQTRTGGYFDASAEHLPLLHLWSLSVEEQFYLVWPMLIVALRRTQPRQLVAVVAALALASWVGAEVMIRESANAAFFQMPARFWELAVGGIVALSPARPSRHGPAAIALGIGIALLSIAIPVPHFPGVGAVPVVLGTALVIRAVHSSTALGPVGSWLSSRPMTWLGRISYSLYLWHWPLLALYRASHDQPPTLPAQIALVASAVVLAGLSYRFVEQPYRRVDPGTANVRLVLSATAISAVLAISVVEVGNALHRDPLPDTVAARASRDQPANMGRCNYFTNEAMDTFPKPDCASVPDKPVAVVIWGDSHALAWEPLAWAIAERKGVAAIGYTRYGCPPALNYDKGKGWTWSEREVGLCKEFNSLAFDRIVASRPDTLILTALWPDGDFEEKFEDTVRRLVPVVRRIILLGPTPYLRADGPRCIESGDPDACAVPRASFLKGTQAIRRALARLAHEFGNVEYVDPTDFFCGRDSCSVLKDGYSLYWDSNHVSSTAAREFAKVYLGTRPLRDR